MGRKKVNGKPPGPGNNQHGGKNSKMEKYYNQRYRYFSKFDEGVMMDDEAYYSTTPEIIAVHIARRCANLDSDSGDEGKVIFDPFCGVGGNCIQFAMCPNVKRVIAVDIDPFKIAMARHNALIYGCANKIDFIVADSMKLMQDSADLLQKQVNVVFLSPPWGGPKYLKKTYFYLDMMPDGGREIFNLAINICPNVAYLLPRNIHPKDVQWLAENSSGGNLVECESNFLNGRTKTVTAYTGDLVRLSKSTNDMSANSLQPLESTGGLEADGESTAD